MRRLAIVVLVAWAIGTAAPAWGSVTGDCSATFNGAPVDLIDRLSSPLELRADESLVFTGSTAGTTAARVALVAGPVEVEAASTDYDPAATDFSVAIDLGEFSPYSVGLYRVRGTVDGCTAEAWVRITGRFPLSTLAGLTGAGLALAGFAGQVSAIASRRRFTAVGAAAAGLLTGGGVAVLGQQFGVLQPSYPALGGCIAAAAGAGALVARTLGGGARERRRRRTGADHPAPAPRPTPPAATEPVGPTLAVLEAAPTAPYWGYVLADVAVFDLARHDHTVGTLRPGTWYLVKREVGAWAHVAGSPEPEGWAALHAINRQG